MMRKKTAAGKRRAGPLDRNSVLAAALALVDRRGIDALSMRALGAELGVEAMSLYKHVPNKGAILDGLVAAALGEVDWTAGHELGWRGRIEHLALALRGVGHRHPDVFALLAKAPPLGAPHLAPMDVLLDALAEAGFERATAVSLLWTIVSYVLGAVASELAQSATPGSRKDKPAAASIETFPNVREAAALLASCDFEAEYLAGLRRILAGAETELRTRAPGRSTRRSRLKA
jgi:AcrR family transcriptional regulator